MYTARPKKEGKINDIKQLRQEWIGVETAEVNGTQGKQPCRGLGLLERNVLPVQWQLWAVAQTAYNCEQHGLTLVRFGLFFF